MAKVILTPREAAICAAEQQVGVLLILYAEKDVVEKLTLDRDYVASRLRSLRRLQTMLRDRLSDNDVLPTPAHRETAEFDFLMDRLKGLVKGQPYEVPLAEERKLQDACDAVADHDSSLAKDIASEVESSRQAITYLREQ